MRTATDVMEVDWRHGHGVGSCAYAGRRTTLLVPADPTPGRSGQQVTANGTHTRQAPLTTSGVTTTVSRLPVDGGMANVT